jgi:hypothetical protein
MKKVFRQISIVILAITIALLGTRELDKVMAQSSVPSCSQSEIALDTGNGIGTGANGISARRFAHATVNVGTDITYTDSVADGASFTINTNGLYTFSFTDLNSTSVGISLNAEHIFEFGHQEDGLCEGTTFCSATVLLSSGDVIRPFSGNTNDNLTRFIIVKVR